MRFFFALICIGTLGQPVHASLRIENFFQSLKTEQIEVLTESNSHSINQESSYPEKLLKLKSILAWQPNYIKPYDCRGHNLRKILKDQGSKPQSFQYFWENCETSIREFSPNLIDHFYKMLTLKYDVVHHPLARTVMFHLPEGINVRGLLLMKGAKKRPLVILRTGIFSSLNEYMAENFLSMMFYDEGPFHLLILPSLSGIHFISDNSSYIFGGFEEALHNILIAKLLKNSNQPISQYIDKINLAGVSMGGNGSIIASLLEKQNREDPKTPLFNRLLLVCPLIDLENTNAYQEQSFGKYLMFKIWGEERLSPLIKKFPGLIREEQFFQALELVDKFKSQYREPLVGWNPIKGIESLRQSNKLFSDAQSWQKYLTTIQTEIPTLMMVSPTDPVVPVQANSYDLKKHFKSFAKITLTKGSHCSLPVGYNWQAVSQTLNFFFEDAQYPYEVRWEVQRDLSSFPKSPSLFHDLDFYQDQIIVHQKNGPPLLIPRTSFDHDVMELDPSPAIEDSLLRWINRNLNQGSNFRLFGPLD